MTYIDLRLMRFSIEFGIDEMELENKSLYISKI